MDHDTYLQDEPFVNILSTSPPSSSLNDENNNPSSRSMARPAGALRSRRNPVNGPSPIILSTSPTASGGTPPGDHMHAPAPQPNVPASSTPLGSSEAPPQDNGTSPNPSSSTTTCASSTHTCPSSTMCGRGKVVPTVKELEAQCKTQDTAHSIDISDFECSLCFRVFFQPVTTICGHVFCKQCLFSSLKYSIQCPLCRHKLETSSVQHKYAVNVVLMNMIEKYFPKEYKDRMEEDGPYQEMATPSEKQQGEEGSRPSSPSWTCIIPSLRSTCNVILSCGGF